MEYQDDFIRNLKPGDEFYLYPEYAIIVYSKMYQMSLTANTKTFYPIFRYKVNDGGEFEQVRDGRKTSYTFEHEEIWHACVDETAHFQQTFKIFETERQALSNWYKDLINFNATTKRAFEVSERILNDAQNSDYIKKHLDQYPEDFV